jgi:hypothetical protein
VSVALVVVFGLVLAATIIIAVEQRHRLGPFLSRWMWLIGGVAAGTQASMAVDKLARGETGGALLFGGGALLFAVTAIADLRASRRKDIGEGA